MMEFYNQTYPKARKQHKCDCCGEKIEIDQKYSYETGKYDGDMFVRKLCLPCNNILNEYLIDSGEEEFSWWEISDWLHDKYCYDCEHGSRNNDNCECFEQNCPYIKAKYQPKEE